MERGWSRFTRDVRQTWCDTHDGESRDWAVVHGAALRPVSHEAVAPVPVEPPAPDRFGLVRPTAPESAGVARLLLFGLAAVLVPAAVVFGAPLLWLSIVSGIIGAALPSRASAQARLDDEHRRAIDAERERRQAQVAGAVETVNANADERTLSLRTARADSSGTCASATNAAQHTGVAPRTRPAS